MNGVLLDFAKQLLETKSKIVVIKHTSLESISVLEAAASVFRLSRPSAHHGLQCVKLTPGARCRLRDGKKHLLQSLGRRGHNIRQKISNRTRLQLET